MIHVTYDLSGIQRFIFQIPRLRSIVGGSRLIDRFDRETSRRLAAESASCELQFAGGGHGHFTCPDQKAADELVQVIVREAHRDGMSVRIGRSTDIQVAINDANEEYPFLPDELDGDPCEDSGLYPVAPGEGRGENHDVHPVVWRRIRDKEGRVRDGLESWAMEELQSGRHGAWPDALEGMKPLFFSDVHSDSENESWGDHPGDLGRASLDDRNRWAVVAMDGNDLGAQFRTLAPDDLKGRRKRAEAVDKISRRAFLFGTQKLIDKWCASSARQIDAASGRDSEGNEIVVLPIRPLVVGGDDIVALCHPAFAIDFVRTVMSTFEAESRKCADLWASTGGALTISAGVLFAPLTYPLHTAIPYAESLLASAKSKGRAYRETDSPPPSCLDWESVTEGLLDSPVARRRRELQFLDTDLDEPVRVKLSAKPYTMGQFERLGQLVEEFEALSLPGTLLHGIQTGLRQGFYGRMIYRAKLAKHRPRIARMLDESPGTGRWRFHTGEGGPEMSTDVLDAVSLWKELRRARAEAVR